MVIWVKRLVCLAALALWPAIAHAAATVALNLEAIHGEYRNGDFEKVIHDLDGFLKSGRSCLRSDSIFLEKHLAVVYAANPATRELGRYHLHRLLDISPTADLIDMFVGEEVDKVFEKVRKEHILKVASPNLPGKNSQKKSPATAPLIANIADPPVQVQAPRAAEVSIPDKVGKEQESSWRDTGTLVGAGTALALVAFTLYYSASPKESASKTYVIPATAAH